ncbi:lanthionine synthetase LanC family protein [Dyadobacter frigoris]|uniref:Lanthionine synthetase C family protein n=1 Tax=Dyadobacter frigoris TaxID=2576211 RepID=A0A4U6CSS6_9BACT|nr:lanthionine synthetase LanC family protein [Dyadobacter frigoris]TKT85988.1 hypothetical protein FDK13_32840 [Dyadobacter frigoris]
MVGSPGFSFDAESVRTTIDDLYYVVNTKSMNLSRFGFQNGHLGIAVFCYLYGIHTGSEMHQKQASVSFQIACEHINSDRRICYPVDFPDLGIVAQYLIRGGVLDLSPNYYLQDVDNYLLEMMRATISQQKIAGFSTGAVGYGRYFLHRAPHDPGRFTAIVNELATAISECVLSSSQGYYWISSPAWLDKPVDLSLLSGMSSVILFLAKAADGEFIKKNSVSALLDRAVLFICEQINLVEPGQICPGFQDGDLGSGYAVMRAGMVFGNNSWYNKGQQIVERCAVAYLGNSDLKMDGCIQRGSCGSALAFDKINRLSANPLLAQAAGSCYRHGLKAAISAGATGVANVSFSEGMAGIGACLIKAIKRNQVDFDELLWLL